MTTLRDEIENYIKNHNTEELPYVCSVDIVSIIEKRIDSIGIPTLANGIYTKKEMETLAKIILQDVKEVLK